MRRKIALLLISMVMLVSGSFAQDAVTYYKQGDTFQTSGQFFEAVKSYDKAIELDQKYVDAYVKRGQCKRQLKPPDYNGSLADLIKAIELDPKSFVAYNSRGGTYKAMMKYDLAMSDFNKAIELDSKNEKALYNRGTLWLDTKEWNIPKPSPISPSPSTASHHMCFPTFNGPRPTKPLREIKMHWLTMIKLCLWNQNTPMPSTTVLH